MSHHWGRFETRWCGTMQNYSSFLPPCFLSKTGSAFVNGNAFCVHGEDFLVRDGRRYSIPCPYPAHKAGSSSGQPVHLIPQSFNAQLSRRRGEVVRCLQTALWHLYLQNGHRARMGVAVCWVRSPAGSGFPGGMEAEGSWTTGMLGCVQMAARRSTAFEKGHVWAGKAAISLALNEFRIEVGRLEDRDAERWEGLLHHTPPPCPVHLSACKSIQIKFDLESVLSAPFPESCLSGILASLKMLEGPAAQMPDAQQHLCKGSVDLEVVASSGLCSTPHKNAAGPRPLTLFCSFQVPQLWWFITACSIPSPQRSGRASWRQPAVLQLTVMMRLLETAPKQGRVWEFWETESPRQGKGPRQIPKMRTAHRSCNSEGVWRTAGQTITTGCW